MDYQFQTSIKNSEAEYYYNLGINLSEDLEKYQRHQEQSCQVCYYKTTVSGQAMTPYNCIMCKVKLMHRNTNVDRLCMDCAKKNRLCKHCGADINLNLRRKKWPSDNS